MKIAIVGAGISGVSTAYALALDGHEVSVFEKNASVSEGASFAHAGLLSRALALPFSHPQWPQGQWFAFFRAAEHIALRRGMRMADLQWLWKWRRNRASDAFYANVRAASELIDYSIATLNAWTADSTQPLEQSQGHIMLFSNAAQAQRANTKYTALKEWGIAHKTLMPEEIWALEPGLNQQMPLHSGLLFANDQVGNCRQFAHWAKEKAQRLGVQFKFNTPISLVSSAPVLGVVAQGDSGVQLFDRVVLCTGSESAALLAQSRIGGAFHTIQSHSLSTAVKEPLYAPQSAVFDSGNHVSITRVGQRVRVWGGLELGQRAGMHQKKVETLYRTLQLHFPGGVHLQTSTQLYKSTLLMSRDGMPLIGPSSTPHVLFNLAHGPNAWAMACGSAQLITDQIAQRPPALEMQHFAPNRAF